MKTLLQLIIICLIPFTFSFGQGTVRGKITDKNGEPLIGVTIVLKSDRSIGVISDLDGNYSLNLKDSTRQTLIISFISYVTIESPVQILHKEVLVKNFVLESTSHEIKQVEVSAKAVKARDYYMEQVKINSTTTIDFVSAEAMKKSGDVNVTTAIARVSGVSTNGSFITVRGIGDRYVKTAINGLRIPTLDPFTNNIKLDIFPASLVDNILITKTASPDLPGDWAGAYISVETKDYPDQLAVNIETSFGYNSQSTFKDFTTSQRSKTDWLGYDNGFREHDHNDFSIAVISPNQYQEFVALGLGSYYNSLGITSNTPWNDYYYKLGLVQLGLLAPALFNDETAFTNAKNLYTSGPYKGEAFNTINAGAAKTGQSFPNNWNTTTRKAPLDFSQSFSIGNQTKLFGKPLGILAGFRYNSSVLYDPTSTSQRVYAVSGLISSYQERQVSKQTNGWSGLLNLAYKLNPNNSLVFMFMPNLTGVNNVSNGYDTINYKTTLQQFYEERKQMVYQIKSENYLPGSKIKIETNASYTNGKSSAPDFKVLEYSQNSTNDNIQIDPTNDPADRYFRYLSDDLFDSRIAAEFPIGSKPGLTRKFKFGGSYQYDKQQNDQYHYYLSYGNSPTIPQSNSIDEILSLENFAINNNSMTWYYIEDDSPVNHSFGHNQVIGGFAMLDYAITPSLRVSGGLRIEQANIFTDITLYHSLGYAEDDIRRNYRPGSPSANPGNLDNLSFLPSANIIYKLKNDEEAPINLRANYSHSVARPSIRELTDVSLYDYELQAPVTGNSNLKMVDIQNYDLRLEAYFKNRDNISVSFFYKDFKNHIELEQSDSYYWQNVNKSNVAGIELEGTKRITKHLDFRANVTFVKSQTEFVRTRQETVGGSTTTYYEDTINRPMFGQAPYIINGILNYTLDSIGLNFTLSYNIQGERLVIASNNKYIPDVYELPRNLLDFKVIKKLGKYFAVSLTVRDILNSARTRSYKYPDNYSVYDSYKYGTQFVLGITYKL